MRRVFLISAAVVMLLAVGYARPAAAASPHERWTIITVNAGPGKAVAQGPINAIGSVHDNFILFPNGTFTNTAVQTYPDGVITLMSSGSQQFAFHPVACEGDGTIAGVFHVVSGTGRYAGLSGSGTISGRITVIDGHTGGQCSAAPLTFVALGVADGVVSFPSP
jgi:hypothetical protein